MVGVAVGVGEKVLVGVGVFVGVRVRVGVGEKVEVPVGCGVRVEVDAGIGVEVGTGAGGGVCVTPAGAEVALATLVGMLVGKAVTEALFDVTDEGLGDWGMAEPTPVGVVVTLPSEDVLGFAPPAARQ